MSGKFNEDLFKKSYSFIDEIQQQELIQLKKRADKEKDPEEKNRIQRTIIRTQSTIATKKLEETKKRIKRQRKKAEIDLVKQGKKPFYLKKSDEKKIQLIEKYQG